MTVTDSGNPFGISFVDAEDVPPPPRKNERNDALWTTIKSLLPNHPGQFAQVKVYHSATGAGQKAGAINNGRDKKFPASQWEARYEVDRDADTSTLFLAYRENGSE